MLPDLEWKVVYVGSAESERHDQVLDTVLVGPVPVGINKFVFQVRIVHAMRAHLLAVSMCRAALPLFARAAALCAR